MLILMETVIKDIGWYLLSTELSNQTLHDVLNSYKENDTDKLMYQNNAFYYNDSINNYDTFANEEWKIVNVSRDIISPTLGYWVYVSSYSRNNGSYIRQI